MENQFLELCTWIFRPISTQVGEFLGRAIFLKKSTCAYLLWKQEKDYDLNQLHTKSVWKYFSLFTNYLCNVDIQFWTWEFCKCCRKC